MFQQENHPNPADKRQVKPVEPRPAGIDEREDALDDAIADSFPASDPPAMTSHKPSADRK